MKCAAHPKVETNLRCGKCGKPICPKCMVQTPVGARCPECARLYKLPTYRVSTLFYLRAAGTAFGMALVTGVIWGVVNQFIPFFYLNLLLSAGVGYAIGEVVSLSVNRKRGRGLAVVAGTGVAISYLVSTLLFLGLPYGLFHIIIDILSLVLGIFVAVTRLR
ncbi:MAG TPA: B-box zinc finger protein [Dehalococcoidales bacterium]|nr:B-box zinc finger protein [Dehalococcoidales bacterium]